MKNMIGPLAALLLCACASTPQTLPPAEAVAPQIASNNMVCEYTSKTGTTIPSKRCYTAEEKEAARQAVKELQDNLPRGSVSDSTGRR